MKQTFADSFYLLALFNKRDSAHELAIIASKEIDGKLVTTDWVLAETADALSDSANRGGCVAFIEDLRQSSHVEVHRASGLMQVGNSTVNVSTRTGLLRIAFHSSSWQNVASSRH